MGAPGRRPGRSRSVEVSVARSRLQAAPVVNGRGQLVVPTASGWIWRRTRWSSSGSPGSGELIRAGTSSPSPPRAISTVAATGSGELIAYDQDGLRVWRTDRGHRPGGGQDRRAGRCLDLRDAGRLGVAAVQRDGRGGLAPGDQAADRPRRRRRRAGGARGRHRRWRLGLGAGRPAGVQRPGVRAVHRARAGCEHRLPRSRRDPRGLRRAAVGVPLGPPLSMPGSSICAPIGQGAVVATEKATHGIAPATGEISWTGPAAERLECSPTARC